MICGRQHFCDLLVLCGGQGTRLRPAVQDRPKPMVAVGDRPFLDFVIEPFVAQGIHRVILCTGYMGRYIEDWYGQAHRHYDLLFSREATPLGTAGAIAHAAHLIQSSPFVVVNGDSVCGVDLEDLLAFHGAKGGCATLTVTHASRRTDAGIVTMNPDARITAFEEKRADLGSGFHNAGIYVFDRTVLRSIPSHQPFSIESDLLPRLLRQGVYGYLCNAPLFDIGTPERLAQFRAHAEGAAVETAMVNSSYQPGRRAS